MADLTNAQKLEVDRLVKQQSEDLDKRYLSYDKLTQMVGYEKELIGIMHKTVAKGTTVPELAYFLNVAKASGLNPLNKEIWCYKDNKDNLIVFTGRDGFLKMNKNNSSYRGMRSSEVMEYDEFELDMIEGTVRHKITTNRGDKILGAYCIVYNEGMRDTIVWLDFDEYNQGQAKWKSSPKMMIKKCAQSAALKEAGGITGIQAEETFTHNGNGTGTFEKVSEPEIPKEESRLLLMIQNAKTIDELKKLSAHCETPSTCEAYDIKFKELDLKS